MPGTPFEKVALENINLEIKEGEFVAVIGHTGCGKSTLVQHFNGLLRPDVNKGNVTVDGIEIGKKTLSDIRKKVGLVFQYPEHQLFEQTVYKDIAFGLRKLKLSDEEEAKRVFEAADMVGLDGSLMERSVYELSGGQKRRVAIAGVLVMKPSYLVLDEPAAGLDPEGKNDMLRFVKKLNKEHGTTIVLISHCMEDVADYAGRVIVMDDGKILLDGTSQYVFSKHELLKSIDLDVPEITRLFLELKKLYPDVDDNVFTVDDAVNGIEKMRLKGVRRL
jgi:energy-coupling factor transport system ATP-binding protein